MRTPWTFSCESTTPSLLEGLRIAKAQQEKPLWLHWLNPGSQLQQTILGDLPGLKDLQLEATPSLLWELCSRTRLNLIWRNQYSNPNPHLQIQPSLSRSACTAMHDQATAQIAMWWSHHAPRKADNIRNLLRTISNNILPPRTTKHMKDLDLLNPRKSFHSFLNCGPFP